MEIKEIQSKKLFKEYEIIVPGKEIDDQIDIKIKELVPKTNLSGFRPGKAPLSLVKKKYEKDVLGEIINKTVQEHSKKLIEEKKLKPLRLPKVEIKKFDKSIALEFIIQIDLVPEFELCEFKDISITKYEVDFTKKETEENYKSFVSSQQQYKSIKENRKVKEGDQLNISIQGIDKDVPENLKKQQNVNVIIGSNYQVLPNIDKLLLNKNVKKDDEILIDVDLPFKDQKNTSKKKFKVKIIEINELNNIAIDDEYLKKNNIKSLDDLKEKVKSNLKDQYNLLSNEISKKNLLDILEKNHTFDLPEGILEDEFNSIWKRVELAKKNDTLDPDDKTLKDNDLKKRYKMIATRRVKIALIVSSIANKNSINVTNQELNDGIIKYASNYPGKEKQIFEYLKNNPSEIEVIKGPIFEKKVIDHVMNKAKINNKKISVKELFDIQTKAFKEGF